MPWLWCIYCTEWYGISESNSLDLEYLYLSILVGGHVAVELGEVEQLVLHGLAGLLVVLGVVPDEGPVLVKVPHKVVVIIELAQGHHGVSAGQQGAGRTVALEVKVLNFVILDIWSL